MKIALLGNCQLQQIGQFLMRISKEELEIVWYLPPFLMKNGAPLVDFYASLETADKIYCQFHDDAWGEFATLKLSKYFDLLTVPTLESPCSSPQINYLSIENEFNIYDIDYRTLELYINGIDCSRVEKLYHDIHINGDLILEKTNEAIAKYRNRFLNGMLISDYSEMYKKSLIEFGPRIYHTHNHPSNVHLQWLSNVITGNANGKHYPIFKDLPEILVDTVPPVIGSGELNYIIKSRPVGLSVAAKIYYTIFESLPREKLLCDYEKSLYHSYTSGIN